MKFQKGVFVANPITTFYKKEYKQKKQMRKLNHEIINTVKENNNYKIEKIIDEKRRHKV